MFTSIDMKKLPKGLVKENGHKYVLLKSLKKDGKVIAKPGYIAVTSGLFGGFLACVVDQIVKDIYPDGQFEIEIWGKWMDLRTGEDWGESTHCFWNEKDWMNETFFIRPE